MMQAILWALGGFVLLGISGAIEAVGDTGATPSARLPFYFVALAALPGALFCFFKALREALAAIRGGGGRSPARAAPAGDAPRPARRFADTLTASGDDASGSEHFDPDAVLARYMEKRAAAPAEAGASEPVQAPAAPPPRPAPRGSGFGRKGV